MALILGRNNRNDRLIGTTSSDLIFGMGGNDQLRGGFGDDTLSGGFGNDLFVFESTFSRNGFDIITDYRWSSEENGEKDVLDLSSVVGRLPRGASVSDFVKVISDGHGSATLSIDVDGRGEAPASTWAVMLGVEAGDYVTIRLGAERTFLLSVSAAPIANNYAVTFSTPADSDARLNSVAEGAAAATSVGVTASAIDADATNNTISYALVTDLSGSTLLTDGAFEIDGATGVIRVRDGSLLDYELATVQTVYVKATSADGSIVVQNFDIALSDSNEYAVSYSTPADSDARLNTVAEGAAAATSVGVTASAIDADATNNTISYALVTDLSGSTLLTDGAFEIDGATGVIRVRDGSLLDYELATVQTVYVKATSTDGSIVVQNFDIALSDSNEYAVSYSTPADSDARLNTVAEGAAAGTSVGVTASAIDTDATNNTISYALVTDLSGSTLLTDGAFEIDGATGVIRVRDGSLLDYELATVQTVYVKATSTDGSSAIGAYTIGLVDQPEVVGFASQTQYSAGSWTISVSAGDLNGDGFTDVVAANHVGGTISMYIGNGDGVLGFSQTISGVGGTNPTDVDIADLNQDGKLDLVVTNVYDDALSIYIGNGDGTFQDLFRLQALDEPNSTTIGDFNSDGILDLATANQVSDAISVYIGLGFGAFSSHGAYLAGDGPQNITNADINLDGHSDLIVANYYTGGYAVLAGRGDGSFDAAVTHSTGTQSFGAASADFNGDGANDIVISNRGEDNISLILSDGAGGMLAPATYSTGGDPFSVLPLDVNLDGNLDLAVANYSSNSVSVFLGAGNGVLTYLADYSVGSQPWALTTGDLNGDIYPDVISANIGSHNFSVLLNQSYEFL